MLWHFFAIIGDRNTTGDKSDSIFNDEILNFTLGWGRQGRKRVARSSFYRDLCSQPENN